jgi:hypothetical protein
MPDNDDVAIAMRSRIGGLLTEAVDQLKKLPPTPRAGVVVVPPGPPVSATTRLARDPRFLDVEALDLDTVAGHLSTRHGDLEAADLSELHQVLVKEAARQSREAGREAPSEVAAAASRAMLLPAGGAGPHISFKASEPNVLSRHERVQLVAFAKKIAGWSLALSALVVLVSVLPGLTAFGGGDGSVDVGGAGWAAAGLALVSLSAVVIAYFAVMGFKNVEYGGGVGGTAPADDGGDDGDDGGGDGGDGGGDPAVRGATS